MLLRNAIEFSSKEKTMEIAQECFWLLQSAISDRSSKVAAGISICVSKKKKLENACSLQKVFIFRGNNLSPVNQGERSWVCFLSCLFHLFAREFETQTAIHRKFADVLGFSVVFLMAFAFWLRSTKKIQR